MLALAAVAIFFQAFLLFYGYTSFCIAFAPDKQPKQSSVREVITVVLAALVVLPLVLFAMVMAPFSILNALQISVDAGGWVLVPAGIGSVSGGLVAFVHRKKQLPNWLRNSS